MDSGGEVLSCCSEGVPAVPPTAHERIHKHQNSKSTGERQGLKRIRDFTCELVELVCTCTRCANMHCQGIVEDGSPDPFPHCQCTYSTCQDHIFVCLLLHRHLLGRSGGCDMRSHSFLEPQTLRSPSHEALRSPPSPLIFEKWPSHPSRVPPWPTSPAGAQRSLPSSAGALSRSVDGP